jgi:hypothetical protein
VIYEYGEPQWDDIDRGTVELRGKRVPVPPQLQHGVTEVKNQASTLRGWQLTAEPWHGLIYTVNNDLR